MNRVIKLAVLMGVLLSSATQLFAQSSSINWLHDYNEALVESQKSGKLLIISVSTTWCGPCRKLKQSTFADARLAGFIEPRCVALALDGDQNQRLVQQLGVTSYPTQIFASAEGRIVGRLEGYVDVAEYSAAVTRALEVAQRAEQKSIASQQQQKLASKSSKANNPQEVAANPVSSRRDEANAKPVLEKRKEEPLALDGFCLVAMIEKAEMKPGKPEHTASFRGVRLQFASADALARFQNNPAKYLPAENGHCVVSWAESKQWVPGKVKLPAIYEDHVYFFATEDVRNKFLKDPEKYVDRSGKAFR